MITQVRVGIIDFGSGNLLSVKYAFERLDCLVEIISNIDQLEHIDCLVIPGVGLFKNAIFSLSENGLIIPIREFSKKKYVLGICLGLQIFSLLGAEGGVSIGLGLINADTVRFNVTLPIPHVGWNSVNFSDEEPLFYGINNGSDFYFTHSYYVDVKDIDQVIGVTEYDNKFASAVKNENVIGVQFHPEKSGKNGSLMLKNFINYYVKN